MTFSDTAGQRHAVTVSESYSGCAATGVALQLKLQLSRRLVLTCPRHWQQDRPGAASEWQITPPSPKTPHPRCRCIPMHTEAYRHGLMHTGTERDESDSRHDTCETKGSRIG